MGSLCAEWERVRRAERPAITNVECRLDPPEGDGAVLLSTLYHDGNESLGDSYLVLRDGGSLTLVGELSELFLGRRTGEWVGIRDREVVDLDGDGRPELRVIGVVNREGPEGECLHAEEQTFSVVVCGARGSGYACTRLEQSYERTIEMSGSVSSVSSQFDYAVAERCRATIQARGLTDEGENRRVTTARRQTDIRIEHGLVHVRDSAGTRTKRLAELLAEGPCPSGL